MHAAGALRERDVKAIIHQDACCSGVACLRIRGPLQSCASEGTAIFSREIFFAQLDPIDACGRCTFDLFQKGQIRVRRFGAVEAVPVRYIAEDEETAGGAGREGVSWGETGETFSAAASRPAGDS